MLIRRSIFMSQALIINAMREIVIFFPNFLQRGFNFISIFISIY